MTTLPEPNLINKYPTPGHYTAEQMLAWGKANAEAEREACENAVEDVARKYQKLHNASSENIADECAAAIRARTTP